MHTVTSADGTTIAYEPIGDGPPVVVVGGANCDRGAMRPLAEQLAAHCTAIIYDRRGRGDSGDTLPYAVEREIEDLDALVAAAGGTASVYGHSSGAALALHAAAHDLPIGRLVLHEPPYGPDRPEERRAAREGAEQVGALLAEGRRRAAVEAFLTAAGMPAEMVAEMAQDPGLVAMAPTLAYDFEVMGNVRSGGTVPVDEAHRLTMPSLVLSGGASPAWMHDSSARIAAAAPNAEHHVIDGHGHFVPPEVLVPVVAAFLAGGGA